MTYPNLVMNSLSWSISGDLLVEEKKNPTIPFVSNQGVEEEDGHHADLSPLGPSCGPSSYLSIDQNVCLNLSLSLQGFINITELSIVLILTMLPIT